LNRFEVIYDDVNEFSVEAGGGYSIPKTMNILLSGTFFGYNLKNEIKPWHKPSLKVSLDGSYTFLEKYTVDAAVFLFGPAPYRYFQSDEMIAGELESRIDLNMGFTYQHNPNFSAFLKLNNILNQQYQLWYRYPVQGFQVMAGLGFSF
jgi:outer membrane receptor protein involved in Fe transport